MHYKSIYIHISSIFVALTGVSCSSFSIVHSPYRVSSPSASIQIYIIYSYSDTGLVSCSRFFSVVLSAPRSITSLTSMCACVYTQCWIVLATTTTTTVLAIIRVKVYNIYVYFFPFPIYRDRDVSLLLLYHHHHRDPTSPLPPTTHGSRHSHWPIVETASLYRTDVFIPVHDLARARERERDDRLLSARACIYRFIYLLLLFFAFILEHAAATRGCDVVRAHTHTHTNAARVYTRTQHVYIYIYTAPRSSSSASLLCSTKSLKKKKKMRGEIPAHTKSFFFFSSYPDRPSTLPPRRYRQAHAHALPRRS